MQAGRGRFLLDIFINYYIIRGTYRRRTVMKTAISEPGPWSQRFKALSHPARLMLLRRLMESERCVSDVEKCLGLSQPNVSQHLKILKDAGIIVGRRERTRICYRIADDRITRILRITFEKG
jgi:DNA-binding transcriptional ArsR family regulator